MQNEGLAEMALSINLLDIHPLLEAARHWDVVMATRTSTLAIY